MRSANGDDAEDAGKSSATHPSKVRKRSVMSVPVFNAILLAVSNLLPTVFPSAAPSISSWSPSSPRPAPSVFFLSSSWVLRLLQGLFSDSF